MHDDNLIEEMCESFEAWFSDDWQHPSAVERDTVGYKLAKAQNALVWQAAWQAALAALRKQEPVASIPAGYKLVPAWPTPEWVQSAAKGIRITTIEHVINDVLAAAPEPPALNSHKMPQHAARHGDLRIDRLYADYYGDVHYD